MAKFNASFRSLLIEPKARVSQFIRTAPKTIHSSGLLGF